MVAKVTELLFYLHHPINITFIVIFFNKRAMLLDWKLLQTYEVVRKYNRPPFCIVMTEEVTWYRRSGKCV